LAILMARPHARTPGTPGGFTLKGLYWNPASFSRAWELGAGWGAVRRPPHNADSGHGVAEVRRDATPGRGFDFGEGLKETVLRGEKVAAWRWNAIE